MGWSFRSLFLESEVRVGRSRFLTLAIVGREEFWKGGGELAWEDLVTFKRLSSQRRGHGERT